MMILKYEFPQNSILTNNGLSYDYRDSFAAEFKPQKSNLTSAELGKAFFTSAPTWVAQLFAFRNKIAKVFGLKVGEDLQEQDRQQLLDNFRCEVGEQVGLFKVFAKTDSEVILGEDDKHLNFRISLLAEPLTIDPKKKKLTISTTVKFNNWLGRLYFLPVKPFHSIIVPKMLRGIIKKLEEPS